MSGKKGQRERERRWEEDEFRIPKMSSEQKKGPSLRVDTLWLFFVFFVFLFFCFVISGKEIERVRKQKNDINRRKKKDQDQNENHKGADIQCFVGQECEVLINRPSFLCSFTEG